MNMCAERGSRLLGIDNFESLQGGNVTQSLVGADELVNGQCLVSPDFRRTALRVVAFDKGTGVSKKYRAIGSVPRALPR
jgi:hypothetical protein